MQLSSTERKCFHKKSFLYFMIQSTLLIVWVTAIQKKKKKKKKKHGRVEDMKFPGVFCIENIEHGVSRSDQGKKGNLNGFWLLAFGLGISKWLNNKDKSDKPTKSRVVLPKISSTLPPCPLPPVLIFLE